ncbi:muconolactone Delta-isomerase family protein [Methylibium sp.]|uniref:muconolactone Delta-isomerase n=1 Tax=Methylibium sp. TaxID=2067992 RepID=UPI00286CE305|nr:muconolactone Delta-isomerase family protein [Methylibium sp.]
MELLLHARLHKPERMSNQEFFSAWKQESVAVLAGVKAGVIKSVWKVPGRYEVIAIVEVASVEQIDPLTHSLPLFKLGYDYLCDFEWTLLGSYEEWAQRLDGLAGE